MNISVLNVLSRREILIAVVQADFKCVKVANKKKSKRNITLDESAKFEVIKC